MNLFSIWLVVSAGMFTNPAYYPDIDSSDFYAFPGLEDDLAGKWFLN